MDTQTQIERLIELAIVQRGELRKLVGELPQLREHLNAEIERVFEETEPQLRVELEEFVAKQAQERTDAISAELKAKIDSFAKTLNQSAEAKYSALVAERAKNDDLLKQAEQNIAFAAQALPAQVKEIVTAELARFPRAGEIDQLRKEFAEPKGLNPRGKWSPDATYNKLDLVGYNGDSFVSNIDGNRERPSRTSESWTLNAARGTGGGGGLLSINDALGNPTSDFTIVGAEGNNYVQKTLVAGANITITESPTAITIIGDEGQISLQDGTAAAPSLFFTNDTDTGLYRPAANTLGISVSGTQIAYFDQNGLTVPSAGVVAGGSIHAANGNANNPSLAFQGDQDTGFFRHQANEIGIALGGTQYATLTSTTFSITPSVTIAGKLTVNGISGVNALAGGTQLATFESSVNGAAVEIIAKGKNSLGTARQANIGLNRFADDVLSISDGTTERLRLGLTNGNATLSGNLTVSGTGTSSAAGSLMVGSSGFSPTVPAIGIYRAATSVPVVYSAINNSYAWSWGLDASSNYIVTFNGGTGFGTTALTLANTTGNATLAGGLTTLAGNLTVGGGLIKLTDGTTFTANLKSGGSGVFLITGEPGTNTLAFGTGSTAEAARFAATTGNLLLGTTTDSANGKLQLATHTTSAGGIGFGTDLSFYRSNSDALTSYSSGTTNNFFLRHSTTSAAGLQLQIDASKDVYIFQRENRPMYIGTNNTTALTLDSSQNATFAGTVTASKLMTVNRDGYQLELKSINGGNPRAVRFTEPANTKYNWQVGAQINNDNYFEVTPSSAVGGSTFSTPAFQIAGGTYSGAALSVSPSVVNLGAALRLNNAYTAGAPTATGYVTIQDSAGNTYKVLVGT